MKKLILFGTLVIAKLYSNLPSDIGLNLKRISTKVCDKTYSPELDRLAWGLLDTEEIHHMLTKKGYEFKVFENSVLIKNQDKIKDVKDHLENKVTDSGMVFSCELKENGDIEVTRMHKIRFDREKKERKIQAPLGDLPWGSIDRAEIHRMLTEKGYEFEVSENSVLIKNQASNLESVRNYFKHFKTISEMQIECHLTDGKIKLDRKAKAYVPHDYAKPLSGHKVVDFNRSEAASIMQGKFMISNGSKFSVLGTYGAGPCLIMAIHCPTTKTAALAHLDASNSISSIKELISKFEHHVDVHFFGGNGSSQNKCDEIYQAVKQMDHVTIKNSDISRRSGGSDASLAIDVQTGDIYSPILPENLTPEKDEAEKMQIMGMSLQLNHQLMESKDSDFLDS